MAEGARVDFVATVTNAKVDVAEGVPGTYSNTTTVNVDPKTGSIVKGGQEQQRFLADGTPVLDLSIVNDDKTITTGTTPRPPGVCSRW